MSAALWGGGGDWFIWVVSMGGQSQRSVDVGVGVNNEQGGDWVEGCNCRCWWIILG